MGARRVPYITPPVVAPLLDLLLTGSVVILGNQPWSDAVTYTPGFLWVSPVLPLGPPFCSRTPWMDATLR